MRIPGEKLYRALLQLYPASFRGRYGAEMLAFYRERRRAGGAKVWPRVLIDLFLTSAAEHLRAPASSASSASSRLRAPSSTTELTMQTFRHTLRGLVRTPAFTAVVLL